MTGGRPSAGFCKISAISLYILSTNGENGSLSLPHLVSGVLALCAASLIIAAKKKKKVP